MNRRISRALLVALLLAGQFAIGSIPRAFGTVRPNILLIISDDQRFDTMQFMPRTRARIFDAGIAFSNAVATTPLCCPGRASIFTGMHGRTHGVHFNGDPLFKRTFAERLHSAGYYTGFVGKYLNSWDGTPRPEYDYWVGKSGASSATAGKYPGGYTNPTFNVNGVWTAHRGYETYLLRDYALTFLNQAAQRQNPFLLIIAPLAPHKEAVPGPGDENLYPNLPPLRPPSHNEADVSDKPQWVQRQPLLTSEQIAAYDRSYRKQVQSLNALDISVEQLLNRLADQGKLDNTLVIYMSDNGYLWGEHRLESKNMAYEESIKIPLGIRYPPLITAPRRESRTVANVDLAPTIYELAGIALPPELDGSSLVPLMRGTDTWRPEILLEGWANQFQAIRTNRYIYVEKLGNIPELYDLQDDPYQLQNQHGNPAYAGIEADLKARLAPLVSRVDSADMTIAYDGWQSGRAGGGTYRSAIAAGQSLTFRTPQPATAITLVTYRGPNQGKARVLIDGVDKGVLDLYNSSPQSNYRKTYSDLGPGLHTLEIRVLGQKNPASSGTEVRVDSFRVDVLTIEEYMTSLRYTRWSGVSHSEAYAGTYRSAASAGAAVSFSFRGTRFSWITARGPSYGQAEVHVDGALQATVDLYNPSQQWRHTQVVGGLADGAHTVQIRVLGTRNPSSTGTTVIFDGYSVP